MNDFRLHSAAAACARSREWGLRATNVQNEIADALTDEAIRTIISTMNGLPDDVMAYVMAYTPVWYKIFFCRSVLRMQYSF